MKFKKQVKKKKKAGYNLLLLIPYLQVDILNISKKLMVIRGSHKYIISEVGKKKKKASYSHGYVPIRSQYSVKPKKVSL